MKVRPIEENWQHLPAPVRPLATAATAAVAAAQQHDEDGLEAAVSDLAALDPAQTGLVLGGTVRLLLEDTHPAGIDGDAVREVLQRCVRSAAGWQPQVDPHVLLLLLAGALGVAGDDGAPPPKPDVAARHAALLLADLLGPRPAPPFLAAALAEIERTEVND
jgi:hypothetical protein